MTHQEWLMRQCQRYNLIPRFHDGDAPCDGTPGDPNCECTLTVCVKRGGWKQGDLVDYSKSTCHAHEILLELCKRVPVETNRKLNEQELDDLLTELYWNMEHGETKIAIGKLNTLQGGQ